MPWYTTDDARRDAERQAWLLDKPQTSKQVTGQGAEAPQWTAADEAMRWLNEVELAQGGANGPTIKLRAAVLTLARDVRGARKTVDDDPMPSGHQDISDPDSGPNVGGNRLAPTQEDR